MIESPEVTTTPSGRHRARLGSVFGNRALIIGAGLFSIVAGGLAGTRWLAAHRDHWTYDVTLSYSPAVRNGLTATALTCGLVAAVMLLYSVRRNVPVRGRRLSTYWATTLLLWAALATMTFMSIDLRLSGLT